MTCARMRWLRAVQNRSDRKRSVDALDYVEMYLHDEDQRQKDLHEINEVYVLENFRPVVTNKNWCIDCGVAGRYRPCAGCSPLNPLRNSGKLQFCRNLCTRMSGAFHVHAYLDRIGLTPPITVNVAGLRQLQYAHLLRVPFENLDIHLGRPIRLDLASFYEKIVIRRRGGFCYELNGLFACLLRSLGFRVDLLSARAANREGAFGPEFDHLALRVDLDQPYLVDVGFGDAFLEPLCLVADIGQNDSGQTFLLSRDEDDWLVRRRTAGGRWEPLYRFTLTPRSIDDFAETCRYHQTAPASHFTQKPVCSIATSTGRLTISGNRLIETSRGNRTEQLIKGEAALRTLLDERFGITGIDRDLLSKPDVN
jgi:N-hydroxyarylamine O-acetyltransferase